VNLRSLPELGAVRDIVIDVSRTCLSGAVNRDPIHKADGSLVTKTDLDLQRSIHLALKRHWPDISFLGEEMPVEQQNAAIANSNALLWCLDPLDGTTNFTSALPFYGISLALVKKGRPRLAVVYDPNRNECFEAQKGDGAYLNGELLAPPCEFPLSRCIACVDLKRLPSELAQRLASGPPYRSQRNLGSSVLEWCWLAAGRFQLYLHGGQQPWDQAAGSLILAEAGGRAKTINGYSLTVAGLDAQSVVGAANPLVFTRWYEWVQNHWPHAAVEQSAR